MNCNNKTTRKKQLRNRPENSSSRGQRARGWHRAFAQKTTRHIEHVPMCRSNCCTLAPSPCTLAPLRSFRRTHRRKFFAPPIVLRRVSFYPDHQGEYMARVPQSIWNSTCASHVKGAWAQHTVQNLFIRSSRRGNDRNFRIIFCVISISFLFLAKVILRWTSSTFS